MLFRLGSLMGLGFFVSIGSGACDPKAAAIGTHVTICGRSITVAEIQPPAGSGPVVLMAVPCFESLGGGSIPRAYRHFVLLKPSRPLASTARCRPHDNASATRGFPSTAPASRATPSSPRPYNHFSMGSSSAPRSSPAHYRDAFARASIVLRGTYDEAG